MEVSYEVSEADVLVSQAEAQRLCRMAISRPWHAHALLLGLSLSLGVAFGASIGMYTSYSGKIIANFSFVFVPGLLGLVGLLAYYKAAQAATRRAHLSAIGPFPLQQTLRVADGVIDLDGPLGRALVPIDRVRSVREAEKHVLVAIKPWTVVAIPKAAFRDSEDMAALIAALRPASGSAIES